MALEYVVTQGDCLASIARRHGLASWKTLYHHPDNAELRRKRPNPNVLLPGDRVMVPQREAKEVACGSGAMHTFRVHVPTTRVKLVLRGPAGQVLAGKQYELTVGAQQWTGTTDEAGKVNHLVPDDAASGELKVWLGGAYSAPLTFPLRLGHLDPHDELTGVQSRLRNLGFHPGPADGQQGPRTRRALRAFQKSRGLQVTGEPDDATRAKLQEEHGG